MGRNPRLRFGLVACAVALALCASVRADVVAAKDRSPLVDTQVVKLVEGKLVCRGENGGEVSLPIEQIDYMQVLGWQMFNLAEKQRRSGDWHRAAVSYEKALADLQLDAAGGKTNADGLDRMLLTKCRLVQVCDTQGRFERALELYLEVVERMPVVADVLRPKRLPQTGSAWLDQADKRIDVVIARHNKDDLGRRLLEWKQSWPRPAASAPAWSADALPGSQFDPRMREAIGRAAGMVQAGRPVEALWSIGTLQGEARGGARAELYYWQGRALQAMVGSENNSSTSQSTGGQATSGTSSNSGAKTDKHATLARAGLAYMRVVVHFPGHQLAGESLYRAGELCRLEGRPEQAKTLWTELVTNYPKAQGPDGKVWADKAREELK